MFRSRFLQCAGREIHFAEWGNESAPAVVMWHGLTRNGRDFDEIAAALADSRRVVCPDSPGRGLSQWGQPDDYRYETYAEVATDLLNQLGVAECDWVGTSMGGLLGIKLAAANAESEPESKPGSESEPPPRIRIRKLVVNDIGPEIPPAALARIAAYAGNPPTFPTVSAFGEWLREAYRPFGPAPESFWQRVIATSVRRLPSGEVAAHYDPAIATPFFRASGKFDMWSEYDSVRCQTLLIRGAQSDVLPQDVAEQMTRRGPKAKLLTFPDCAHAPALATPKQIAPVRKFLLTEN